MARGEQYVVRWTAIIVAGLAAVSLSACSTIDVVLEKADGAIGPSVSAVARAPTFIGVETLITKVDKAFQLACSEVDADAKEGEESEQQEHARAPAAAEQVKKLTAVAQALKELRDSVLDLFPKNSYTAARFCN